MVGFQCSLERPGSTASDPAVSGRMLEYPEVLESQDVAIMRACELLAETGVRFHVGGFGADDWNLDVRYDLSVFLEQLAGALGELNAGKESEIALYSQGVERALVFRPQGAGVRIRCISGTSWKPDPAEEKVTSRELISMLTQLAVDFSGTVIEVDGNAAQVELISSWLRGII
jgi:hypothetical protein